MAGCDGCATAIDRARLRAAGAQPVRRRRVPAAADVRGGLAEPAALGPAGPDPLCRTGQLAVGARPTATFGNSLLVTVAVRRVGGAGADRARPAGRVDAGPPAAGQRVLPHAVRAAVDLRAAGHRRAVAVDAGSHRRRGQHACWAVASSGSPIPAWRCQWCRRSPSGPTSATSRCSSWPASSPSPTISTTRPALDGATAWQRFWRITLPLLRPTMFFVLVTGIVSAAQVFDTVYALTGGGPQDRTDLVAHRIYAEAFGAAAVGRAAVMAVVLFAILVGVTIVQHLYFRRRISYDLI